MAHPAVLEAAVVAVPDERWQERPLAAVVIKEDASATATGATKLPVRQGRPVLAAGAWTFIDEVPKTSVGKFDKKHIRSLLRRRCLRRRRVPGLTQRAAVNAQRIPPTTTRPDTRMSVASTGGKYGSRNGIRAHAGNIATDVAASRP